jgi:hypothetical protein
MVPVISEQSPGAWPEAMQFVDVNCAVQAVNVGIWFWD